MALFRFLEVLYIVKFFFGELGSATFPTQLQQTQRV